jgi:peroxiredoxin
MFAATCWAVASAWIGCNSPSTSGPSGTITGEIQGAKPGSAVVLRSFSRGNLVNVAEATLDSAGNFTLTPEKSLSLGHHQLVVNRTNPLVLITDSTEHVHVRASVTSRGNYLVGADIDGSPQSVEVAELYDVIMPISARLKDVERQGRSVDVTKRQEAKTLAAAMADSINDASLAFAQAHAGSLAALNALEGLDAKEHKELFKATLSALEGAHADNSFYRQVNGQYDRANKPRTIDMTQKPKRGAKNGKYATGDMAPDIVMNDPSGVERKLSDLRGKVVLVDFWASWCGPCRRENPNVVRAYAKYRDQGFEVFSVSLDSKADRWASAIEQDQLTWTNHVSDLKGWRNAAAQDYGISSIPHTMLIDRDGSILATHLRGSALESSLRGIFGE